MRGFAVNCKPRHVPLFEQLPAVFLAFPPSTFGRIPSWAVEAQHGLDSSRVGRRTGGGKSWKVFVDEALSAEKNPTAAAIIACWRPETRIEALHAMVEELQRARDSWQAQAERLALMAPTVIAAPGPVETREADAPIDRDKNTPISEPAPRRSLLRYWFSLRAAG